MNLNNILLVPCLLFRCIHITDRKYGGEREGYNFQFSTGWKSTALHEVKYIYIVIYQSTSMIARQEEF